MPEAFQQEKAEDGKSSPADIAENKIYVIFSAEKRKQDFLCGLIHTEQHSSDMIDQHGDDRDHLQSASAENTVFFWKNIIHRCIHEKYTSRVELANILSHTYGSCQKYLTVGHAMLPE